jgi:hypothetical protein
MVRRDLMMECLADMGLQERMLRTICSMYWKPTLAVKIGNSLGQPFESTAHNSVLKMSIIWYLTATHMSLYVIGIALCLTRVSTAGTPDWSVGSLMLGAGWLNL